MAIPRIFRSNVPGERERERESEKERRRGRESLFPRLRSTSSRLAAVEDNPPPPLSLLPAAAASRLAERGTGLIEGVTGRGGQPLAQRLAELRQPPNPRRTFERLRTIIT